MSTNTTDFEPCPETGQSPQCSHYSFFSGPGDHDAALVDGENSNMPADSVVSIEQFRALIANSHDSLRKQLTSDLCLI